MRVVGPAPTLSAKRAFSTCVLDSFWGDCGRTVNVPVCPMVHVFWVNPLSHNICRGKTLR